MVDLELFDRGDVYIDYPFEDARFRYDKQTRRYYRRFYGKPEVEIPHSSNLFREAISAGKVITKEEYYRD